MRHPIRLIILLLAALAPAGALRAEALEPDNALAELDRVFAPSFAWWVEVYDPESGGYFYSLSARDSERFGPDIESTQKGVRVLEWSGTLGTMPGAFKQGVVRFMQERQDPESGFFHDPQNLKDYTHNTRSRALGMATQVLELCGGKPKHPLPTERTADNRAAARHYEHLASPEAFRAWLEALPWDKRVWTAGGRIRTQAGILKETPEPLRGQLLDVRADVVARQQKDDGLLGSKKDKWESRLSGTYKAASCLEANGRPIPNAGKMAATILDHLHHTKYDNLIVLYNTVNILTILDRASQPLSTEQKEAIIRRATELMQAFVAKDGGFTSLRGRPAWKEVGFVRGKKVVEGIANATGLAHKTRLLLHQLAKGGDVATVPHPQAAGMAKALAEKAKAGDTSGKSKD